MVSDKKIATLSWGGDLFFFYVLLLVLFEELGDEGGDFFCVATDAVVFVFDDGELWSVGVGGEVLLATPEGYEAVVFAMEDEDGALVGTGCAVNVELLGGEEVFAA